MLSAACTR